MEQQFITFDQFSELIQGGETLVECPLPSGLLVRVKQDVDLEELAFSGSLPLPLLQKVQEMTEGGEKELDIETMLSQMNEFRPMFVAMFNDALQEVLVKIEGDKKVFKPVTTKQKEVIGSRMGNVLAVVNKVMEVPGQLENFPGE